MCDLRTLVPHQLDIRLVRPPHLQPSRLHFPSSYNNTCAYTREVFVVGGEVYEDRYMFTGRMYNFKYYDDDGNNLLVDLVPCYRKSDNKPGMYDIVRNQLYTNQGSGEFIVGPDKEWEE
jgi:hypothetical protein